MKFIEWLSKKYCKGCQIQSPCEKCFVHEGEKWYSLVMQWKQETKCQQ